MDESRIGVAKLVLTRREWDQGVTYARIVI